MYNAPRSQTEIAAHPSNNPQSDDDRGPIITESSSRVAIRKEINQILTLAVPLTNLEQRLPLVCYDEWRCYFCDSEIYRPL